MLKILTDQKIIYFFFSILEHFYQTKDEIEDHNLKSKLTERYKILKKLNTCKAKKLPELLAKHLDLFELLSELLYEVEDNEDRLLQLSTVIVEIERIRDIIIKEEKTKEKETVKTENLNNESQ